MTPEEIKDWIWSRCHWDGDCLLWDGAVDDAGVPQLRLPGSRKVQPARRVLMEAMGKEITGLIATTRCDCKRCMAEEHVVAWSRKRLQQRSAQQFVGNVARSARIARAAQAKSRLTMEQVKQAREQRLTADQFVELYGGARSTAIATLNGSIWKDYSNPFGQLARIAERRQP